MNRQPDENVWFTEKLIDSKTGKNLYLWNKNNKITAILYVDDNKLKHVFTVRKLKNQFNFIYKHSSKISWESPRNGEYKGKEVLKIKKIDSLKYNVIVYKNPKLKKKKIDAIVYLEKAEFEDINFEIDHIFASKVEVELKKILDPKFKFIIRRIDRKYNSVFTYSRYIENIQKVNLKLMVPDNPLFIESSYLSDFE